MARFGKSDYNEINSSKGERNMEEIREKIPMLFAILLAIVVCGLAYYFLEYHQLVYYTQVDNMKLERISASDDMKFEYTLECYSERGKNKKISFKTSRELREDAYLMLELTVMGVHAWKEVQYEELPEEVKINYEEN